MGLSDYLGVLGVGFMFAPQRVGIGAVPSNPSPALLAYLRIFGGPCVGNCNPELVARDAEPSSARPAIVIAMRPDSAASPS